jgi:hypothetical protein
MADFDPLLRAKKIAEQATLTALDARQHASTRATEIREMTTSRAGEAAGFVSDIREQAALKMGGLRDSVVGKMADIKDATFAGIKDLVDDFNAHIPALREAGYAVSEVAVELGLVPKMVASFACAPDISQERIDAVVEEHREAKMTVALLRALHAAYKLQNSIHVAGMTPRGIVLEIGVAPSVVVKFA